jgi:hypothetical protein
MSRTAYHQAYYQAHKEANRASARAYQRRRREREAIIRIVCEAVEEARNDKPPFGGLTRAGGWPYSRDACRGVVTIDRGNRSVNHPPPSSGISGRGNYAQSALNPHRGRQPVGAQRQSGSANVTGKPEK